MNRLRGWLGAVVLVALSAGSVHASSPTSTYVYPSKVDFFPDQTNATSVVIHGAFFFLDGNGSYTAPTCGYMYFTCVTGSESMCRMQWDEIAAAIGGLYCAGFGAYNVVSTATVRTEGTTPANPDKWDLGMGVSPGVSVSQQCPAAQQLKCLLPTVDMGVAPDMTVVPPPADMTTPPPAPDLTVLPDLTQTQTQPPKSTASCTLGGPATDATPAALLGALLLVGLIVRRRRAA